ncbi:MAG: twin-arginine translocation signal domain-containing protein, partial [Pseudomonadota bacterium]
MTLNTSRRGFLQGAAAAGAVLAIGLDARGVLAKTDAAGGTLTPFVTVSPEGKVTAIVKHFE